MAVFYAPRIRTINREEMILGKSEIVYDIDLDSFFGGDGVTLGGFPLSKGTEVKTITVTLTEQNILNKQVELSTTPYKPENVTLVPVGGIAQINGEDFFVSENIISWDNLGLDGFLEIGDTILVQL